MSGTRRKPGVLGPQVECYRVWLTGQAYTPGTVRNMLKDLGQLGRWLSSEELEAGQLNEGQIEASALPCERPVIVACRVLGRWHHC